MRGAILHTPGDVRLEDRDDPKIIEPTDTLIRMSATCVCGSDLWDYRGINPVSQPTPMGHEYCGIVEEVGNEVASIKLGQFVIGSFFASDNTCPNCRAGFQSSCQHREFVGGAQTDLLRVPLADGTLVATPEPPAEELIPSLLTLSDVMGTGWFTAVSANVQPGMTVAVVGDGTVGLLSGLTEESHTRSDSAGLAAGPEALDRSHSRDAEAGTPRGEHRAVAVELTADDLREIENAASEIKVQGARYPEHLERLTGH